MATLRGDKKKTDLRNASSTRAARPRRARDATPNTAPTSASGGRRATEERLIAATRASIAEAGIDTVGVNQISARAGVPKQLIYRYFGDLKGLLLASIESKDFWLPDRLEKFLASLEGMPFEEKVQALVSGHADSLRQDAQSKEIRRYELVSRDELANSLAAHREAGGRMIRALLAERPQVDPAMFGLVLAGISYLILRERTMATYIGIDIRGDAAWKRWQAAARGLVQLACSRPAHSAAKRSSLGTTNRDKARK